MNCIGAVNSTRCVQVLIQKLQHRSVSLDLVFLLHEGVYIIGFGSKARLYEVREISCRIVRKKMVGDKSDEGWVKWQ